MSFKLVKLRFAPTCQVPTTFSFVNLHKGVMSQDEALSGDASSDLLKT